MNLDERKNIFKTLLEEKSYINDTIILKLLKRDSLDKLIMKLDNKDTICGCKAIVKKGYFTAEEQFLDILDHFISHLNTTFFMLENSYTFILLEQLLKSKYCKVFFLKKYWGDNNNITLYKNEFDKIIIESFINNLNYLTEQYTTTTTSSIKNIITFQNNTCIYTKKFTLSDELFVYQTLSFLRELLLCNMKVSQFTSMYLFLDIKEYIKIKLNKVNDKMIKQKNKDNLLVFYNNTWMVLYENYQELKEYARFLL